MEQPAVRGFRPVYVQSVPCDIVLGPYAISVRTLDDFEPLEDGHCRSLVLDLPEGQLRFPCPHSLPPGYSSYKDLLSESLTSWFSALGFPQDCVDRLVKELTIIVVSTAVRNHIYSSGPQRMVGVPYVSVSLSMETALKFRRATEESIEALEMVGSAELDDDDSCVICFDDLEAEGVGGMARMPCKHVYHKECIAEWLRSSHVCPLCRFEMPVMEASSSS